MSNYRNIALGGALLGMGAGYLLSQREERTSRTYEGVLIDPVPTALYVFAGAATGMLLAPIFAGADAADLDKALFKSAR